MAFDEKVFSEAIEEFLLKADFTTGNVQAGLEEVLGRIASVLGIARITADFYECMGDDTKQKYMETTIYQDGEEEPDVVYTEQKKTMNGCLVDYKIYANKGKSSWSEVELDRIKITVKLLFFCFDRVQTEKMANYLIYHDKKLGCFNMDYYHQKVQSLMDEGKIENYGACYFNIKQLGMVNQKIGRDGGTKVLAIFIAKLNEVLKAQEYVCRVARDNFIILFRKNHLEKIMEYLSGQEIIYNHSTGESIYITVWAGYYMIPDANLQASEIMDNASIAYNMAKTVMNQPYAFYDQHMLEQINDFKRVEEMFELALLLEEFKVYYQPKIMLKGYKLAGAEALCRWVHDGEVISPERFIPILEKNMSICKLDFYMLEHVCRDIRHWLDDGKEVVKVSVNLSRCHFGDVHLLEHLLAIIDKYEIPHEYIEIELTETTTDVGFKDLKEIVFGLQKEGISTSVDDFGVGYSSLNLIRELPWNVIKIDKSFLQNVEESSDKNKIMLRHVIQMAQEIGMECIVEGVETIDHIKLLKENSCYMAQGYFFDTPLPEEVFREKLGEDNEELS